MQSTNVSSYLKAFANCHKNPILFWAIVALAFLLRAVFIIAVGPDPRYALMPDSASYIIPAKTLIRYGTFSSNDTIPLVPETARTPGYPLFLILFSQGDSLNSQAIVWTQAVLGALTAGLVFVLGLILWGSTPAATVAGLGMAVDFVTIVHMNFILTEIVFVFVFVLALLALTITFIRGPKSWLWISITGILLGIAAMVRPVSLYYFIFAFFILAWAWRKEKIFYLLLGLGLFLLTSTSIPLSWALRNKMVSGTWTFSSIQGLAASIMRAPLVEMRRDDKSYDEAISQFKENFYKSHPNGFYSPAEEASQAGAWATKFIFKHPVKHLEVLAEEALMFFAGNSMKIAAWLLLKDPDYDPFKLPTYSTESGFVMAKSLMSNHPGLGVSLILCLTFLAVTYLTALKGFLTAWKKHSPAKAVLTVSSAFYIFAVTVGAGAHARYRIPAMPSIFLLAGLGIESLMRKSKKSNLQS